MEDDSVNVCEEPRAKRLKKDKGGRFAALQKLKDLQGKRSKNKYEVDNVNNVYDVVDEKEYTKRVLDRQDEDWIVDDEGIGYIEDGREIFDDDLDAESIANASSKKGRGNKRKKKNISENAGRGGNLHNMLSNMPAKKKEEKLEDDDILSEIMNEIDQPTASTSSHSGLKNKPKQRFSLISEKKAASLYMKSFSVPKPVVKQPICRERSASPIQEDQSEIEDIEMEEIANATENKENEDTLDNKKEEPVAQKKLLFTISEKKTLPSKIEEVSMAEESNIVDHFDGVDFDDDFDFDNIDSTQENNLKVPDITEEQLLQGFTFVGDSSNTDTDVMDLSEVPQSSKEDGKNVFRFFWWDAYEDERNQPGVVLLFGKTFSEEEKKFVSCCVVIKNVQRKIYLLPRPFFLDKNGKETDKPVSIMDVYQEFNEDVAKAYNMSSYKSKKVTKKYAFDSSVPEESEYLEVRFEGKYDFQESTYKTFSHIFGMNSSFLEIFLLERKIKGPCWLNVSNFEVATNPYTHTTIEVRCSKTFDVSVMETTRPVAPPPLVVMALNIKAGVNPKNNANEIALISCLVNNRYHLDKQAPNPPFHDHFCVLTKLSTTAFPNNMHIALTKYKATRVQKIDSEKALLNYFMAQFVKIDPDLIVGHDLNGYQFTILSDRLQATSATNYSRLARIKRSNTKNLFERHLFSGRLVCDIKSSAKELIRCRSYDLDPLCQNVLKIPEGQRIEIEPENIPFMYESSVDLFKFISITMQDTAYILKMMYELNVIPLALQITNIAGNVMSRTLLGGRSERNEYLLLHAFNEKDYVVPEKMIKKKSVEVSTSKRKKPTYSGGLVLEPKVGFYDKLILLMDFNSLYPSIIQEYNICFTTMSDVNGSDDMEALEMPDKSLPPGILPTEIRKLVESRREVKKLMKNPDLSGDLQLQYNIRQMALKLTANSMYGCLGFSNSRFFAKKLAALVTQKGREILTITRDIVQKLSYDVIYGDTDSIMINTNIVDYEQVFKIGKSIKQEINQMYKQVELDIDGVFKYLLLLKKKKYAAVSLTKGKYGKLIEVQEHKGLDIVRRDWSQLAAEAGKFVLNQILSDQSTDDRIENILKHLEKLKEDLEANSVPLTLLVITKQLTKDPNQYPDKNSLPHVQVALRHNKTKGKKFKAGDTVPYVICLDGSTNSATQRAYLLDELKTCAELKIDTAYYLGQQIYPVVSRILEPIENVDPYQIGNSLGVDVRVIKKPAEAAANQFVFTEIKRVQTLTRNCKPFTFNCLACNYMNTIADENNDYALEMCGNVDCNVRPVEYVSFIKNKLILAIRSYQMQYYKNEFTCEDPSCTVNTFKLPQRFYGRYPVCTQCNQAVMYKVYSEEELYAQLIYFQRIFDLSKKNKQVDGTLEAGYVLLKDTVDKFINVCGYATVNLNELFSDFTINKSIKEELQIDSTQLFDDGEAL